MPVSATTTASTRWVAPILRALAVVIPGMVERHFQLGVQFFRQNKSFEARRRLAWALVLQPNHTQALFYLSWLLVELQRYTEARGYIERLLQLQPKSQEARYLLARATECAVPMERLPTTTPVRFLQRSYGKAAERYDAVMGGLFGMQSAAEVVRRLVPYLPRELNQPFHVLDIGCGTGMVGRLLWPHGVRIEGVDVVNGLLKQARAARRATDQQLRAHEKIGEQQDYDDTVSARALHQFAKGIPPVYGALWSEDLRDFLARQTAPRFHAIVAADVLPELGAMAHSFVHIGRALLPGGVFICSSLKGPMQGFAPAGRRVRFAHSTAYLDAQAERAGLQLVGHSTGPYDAQNSARYSIYQKPAA